MSLLAGARRSLAIVTLHADPMAASGTWEGGGTNSYIREMMVGLAASDWQVTVLTRWADPELPERETISNRMTVVRLRIGEVGPIDKRLLNGMHHLSVKATREAFRQNDPPQLLHSVYWNSGRVARELSAGWGVRFVHTVISNGWRRVNEGALDHPEARLQVERIVYNDAAFVFCIANQERDDLVEHYGVDHRKIIVVGRPVADNFIRPCHDELGKPDRPLQWKPAQCS